MHNSLVHSLVLCPTTSMCILTWLRFSIFWSRCHYGKISETNKQKKRKKKDLQAGHLIILRAAGKSAGLPCARWLRNFTSQITNAVCIFNSCAQTRLSAGRASVPLIQLFKNTRTLHSQSRCQKRQFHVNDPVN